jgi:DNA-binding Lrp family transcriptional regulator
VRGAHPRRALRDLFSDLDARGIHATPRAVAAALWSFTNANGGCWPSQRRLARMTGRCERTVRSAVRELEAAGVILRRVPDLRMRRVRHATTVYRLLVGDAPPLGAQRAEPPAVLVDAAARVAALVGRDLVAPVEMPEAVDLDGVPEAAEFHAFHARAPEAVELVVPVDLVADPEPPLVEFLPPEAVDLDGVPELVDAVQPGARPIETSTGKGFAREDSADLPSADLDGVPHELVDAAPEEPPLVVPVEREEPPAITGSRCRISEPTNTLTAEQRARPIDDAADLVVPVGRPRGAPRRLQRPTPPPPRGGPVRAFVVPVAASTRAAPSAPAAEPPTRSTATTPPPALAAAAARCAALARRR